MTDVHIRCESLVRIFKTDGVEVQALQGLDLRVTKGEMMALVGASGSGKSTLLNILSGLDQPTAGAVVVAGHDLLAMRRRERLAYRRHTVGFVWQQTSRNLLPYLTAAENVAVPMMVARTAGERRRRQRAGELLELFGLEHCRDRRPGELSGGEQQRVALATAMANAPEVLLADEPTGELDEHTSHEVLDAIAQVNAQLGATVVIVTHDAAVSHHVPRTVQIRDGRTSTEKLRRTEVDEQGDVRHVAHEFVVVDAAGRLQLPQEFTDELDIRDRARLDLERDHISVWPDRRADAPARSSDE